MKHGRRLSSRRPPVNKVVVNYSGQFGLPGADFDSGLALLYLLCSDRVEIPAIILSTEDQRYDRNEAALRWLFRFAGRDEIPVLDSFEVRSDFDKTVLFDIGSGVAAPEFMKQFSCVVFWSPENRPFQRAGEAPAGGALDNPDKRDVLMKSGCSLRCFGNETGFQNPIDIDYLAAMRCVCKPLYFLLKDLCGVDDNSGFLYRLPAAVSLTDPELFSFSEKEGGRLQFADYITDINRYNSLLVKTWASIPGRRRLYEI